MAEDSVKIRIEAIDNFSKTIDNLNKQLNKLMKNQKKVSPIDIDKVNKKMYDLSDRLIDLSEGSVSRKAKSGMVADIEEAIKKAKELSGIVDGLLKNLNSKSINKGKELNIGKKEILEFYGEDFAKSVKKNRDAIVKALGGISQDIKVAPDKESIDKTKKAIEKPFKENTVIQKVITEQETKTKKEVEGRPKRGRKRKEEALQSEQPQAVTQTVKTQVKAEADKSSVRKAVDDIQKEAGSKHIKIQVDPIADFSKAFAGFKDKLASLYAQKDAIDDLSKTPVRHHVGRLKDELAQFTISDMDRLGANDLNNRFKELKKKLELAEKAVDSALRTASSFNVGKKPKTELSEALAGQIQKNGDTFLQNIEKFKDKLKGVVDEGSRATQKSEVTKPLQVTVDKSSVDRALGEIQKEVSAKPIKAKVEVDQNTKTSKQEKPKPTETKTKKTTKEPNIVDEIKEQAVPTQKVKVAVDNESISSAKKQIQKKLDSEPLSVKIDIKPQVYTKQIQDKISKKPEEVKKVDEKASKILVDEKLTKGIPVEGIIKKLSVDKNALDVVIKAISNLTGNISNIKIDQNAIAKSISETINTISKTPYNIKIGKDEKYFTNVLQDNIKKASKEVVKLKANITYDKEALAKLKKEFSVRAIIDSIKLDSEKVGRLKDKLLKLKAVVVPTLDKQSIDRIKNTVITLKSIIKSSLDNDTIRSIKDKPILLSAVIKNIRLDQEKIKNITKNPLKFKGEVKLNSNVDISNIKPIKFDVDSGAILKSLGKVIKEANKTPSKVKIGRDDEYFEKAIRDGIKKASSEKLLLKIGIDNESLVKLKEKGITLKGIIKPLIIDKESLNKLKRKGIKLGGNISQVNGGVSKKDQTSKDTFKTLQQQRNKAVVEMDKAYQDYGKTSSEFRKAQADYRDAQKKLQDFQLSAGVGGNINSVINDLKRQYAAYGNNKPVQDIIKDELKKAYVRRDQINKELSGIEPQQNQTMKNAMAIRNQYQTLAAEAQKYARQAEMAWRNAGNRPSEQFDKWADKYVRQMAKIMDFGRDLGSRSLGSDIAVLSNLSRSLDRSSPIYERTLQQIRNLREEQERLKRATETAAQAAARQRREQRLESSARNQNASDITTFGGAMAYITHFVGRSSKGAGSFGEAVADAAVKLRAMGGTLGALGTVMAGVSGIVSSIVAVVGISAQAFSMLINAAQTLGTTLIQIGQQIYQALRPGIELYKQQQSAIFSFTAALQSNGILDNGKGQRLSAMGSEGRDIARGLSTDLINRATLDAELSAFSLRDLLSSLQGTLPMLMQRGMSVEQAYQVNRGVAGVAKMIQLSPSQILQETRDLAQGSITARTSQVANALGITNEDIAKYKGDADGLFNYLMEKFKNYNELLQEFEDTALGRYQQLEERWSTVTEKIIEGMLPQFKGLFETLIELTGQWRDKTGAYLDALTGRWYRYNEETGQTESLDKVDSEGNIVEKYNPKGEKFYLSEALEEVKASLIEILDFVAMTADGIAEWAEEAFGVTDPIQTAKDILKIIIEVFADIVVIIGKIIEGIIKNQKLIFDVLSTLWRIGAFVISFIELISVVAKIFKVILGLVIDIGDVVLAAIKDAGRLAKIIAKAVTGDVDGAKKELFDKSNLERSTEALGSNLKNRLYDVGETYVESLGGFAYRNLWNTPFEDINSIEDLSNSISIKAKKGKIFNALHRNDNEKINTGDSKGIKADTVRGEAASKANKQSIKEAQKMLKEQIASLREVLKDRLDELKQILKQNKIAYEEGFMSIKDYFTEKARIEAEEARLELEYAQQEKELLLKTPFENEYDRLKELHSVDRRISEYSRKLEGAIQGQKEVQQAIKRVNDEFKEFGDSFFPATNALIEQIRNIKFTVDQPGDEVTLAPGEMEWAGDLYKILNKEGVKNETISELLQQVSKDYGGNAKLAALALSVLAKESAGNPKARSDAGAVGLMQLMPATARRFGLHVGSDYDDRLDPKKNISAGLAYLDYLSKMFKNNLTLVSAAYNAGEGAVSKYGGVPPYRETQNYTKGVTALNEQLSNAIKSSDIQVDGKKVGSTFSDKLKDIIDSWHGTPYVFGGNSKKGVDCSGLIKEIFSTIGIDIRRRADWQWEDFVKKNATFKDSSKLNLGDLVFMRGHGHIGIVSGNNGKEPLVTHASSGMYKKVVEVPLSTLSKMIDEFGSFAKYTGMTTSKGTQTSIPGASKQSRANQTEIGHEATTQYEQFKDNILDMIAESNSKLLNIYDKSFSQLNSKLARIADKYKKQLNKIELNMQEDPNIREQARLAVIRDQEKEKLDTEHSLTTRYLDYAKTIMGYWQGIGLENMSLGNLSNPEYANKLDYLNKQSNYYTQDNGEPIRIATLINRMWKEAFTAENLGFTELAASIRVKVLDTMKAMENHVNQYIERLSSYFSNYSTWLNATGASSLQKEYGNKEIEARENQIKSRIYGERINQLQPQLEAKIAEIEKNRLKYAQAIDEVKKKEIDDAYKLLEAQKLQLQNDIDNYKQKKLISDELGDTNIRLKEVQQTAKNAFENGLLEFLTDGITQAESLGDALRNMAFSFAQEMQKLFAKQAVASIMNSLFPLRREKDYGTDSRGEARDVFAEQTNYEGRVSGLSDQYDGINQLAGTSELAAASIQELGQAAQQATKNMLSEESSIQSTEGKLPTPSVERVPTAVEATAQEIQTSGTNLSTALQTAIDKVVQALNRFAEAVQKVTDSLPQNNQTRVSSTTATTGGMPTSQIASAGNPITNLFGSSFMQFLGSGFAAKTLFSGDTKEKILSMLYLESQLIYQTLVAIKQLIASSGSTESSASSSGSGSNGGTSGGNSTGGNSTGGSGTNFITNLVGSNFMQTLGSIFSVYTLFSGDTKEKLLSMIFLELQLIYARLSTMVTGFGFSKGGIVKLATGGTVNSRGIISGPGTSTSDSIPAMLSDGEAIINAKAVKKLGTNFISAVNNGDFTRIRASLPHFAEGGVLGDAYQNTARGMTDFAKSIGTNVSTTNNMNVALVRDESEALEHFMRSPQGQRILVDFQRGNGRIFSQFHN